MMKVRVLVNGQADDRTVDVYEAMEALQTVLPAEGEPKRSALHALAVKFFNGRDSDWTYHTATAFWSAVVKEVNELGKGESESETPS